MNLKYNEEIKSIENCPSRNEKGNLKLYRCVENPITERSFEPHAVLYKPRFRDDCQAWGISMFVDLNTAKQILKNLSINKKKNINIKSIASGLITDNDGIKHSSKNSKHYTFYPKIDVDLISKFAIEFEEEKIYEK